jgi:hypothetical protein
VTETSLSAGSAVYSSIRPGSPSAPGITAVSRLPCTQAGARVLVRRVPRSQPCRAHGRAARPPRSGRQTGDRRRTDRGIEIRAGRRRPRPVERGGARKVYRAQQRYMADFGFPFIIAVKGHDKDSILAKPSSPVSPMIPRPSSRPPAPRLNGSPASGSPRFFRKREKPMRKLKPETLTAEAFAPFGTVMDTTLQRSCA